MSEQTYVGGELDLFAAARHWKKYWVSRLRPYLRGSVLEVGAGLGANTALLRDGGESRWLCLEPDPALVARLRKELGRERGGRPFEARTGTVGDLGEGEQFDTILYIDVLEHIDDDGGELQRAAGHLAPGGHLVVLSPAHRWLFSPFDAAIGHFRRYTARDLEALTPAGVERVRTFYLDSVGMLASAANRMFLRQSMPNANQIHCWDNWMIPCSRWVDQLTGYRLGKSVVGIWRKSSLAY